MKKRFRNKQKLKTLFVLVLIGFYSNIVQAQPGWVDFTDRYFYTVLDVNGKEVSFKNNKDYSIMIDSILYKSQNIPNDSLKYAKTNFDYGKGFENQIKINDFSMVNYQKDYYHRNKRLEIKIIHKNDTMYICQSSGSGSFSYWENTDLQTERPIELKADYTLQFIAGHYYFPNWATKILNEQPESSGNVKIINVNQRHFIVPSNLYNSVAYNTEKYEQFSKVDNYVTTNFIKGYFSLEKRIEPTKFEKSSLPYKSPRWSGKFYSTRNPNRYYLTIDYSLQYSNCFSSINIFSILNKKENTIEQFFPKKNPRLFSCYSLYADTFNKIIYLPMWIKQDFNYGISDCDNLPREKYIYLSEDEGKSWKESKKQKKLFDKYAFENFEFLDHKYAVGYRRNEIYGKVNKNKIVQGIYFLLKNMQVIDSLKTPNDIYYNTNYNNYGFSRKNNTVFLGIWTYDDNYTVGKTSYFQPFLKKVRGLWKFQIEEKTYSNSVKGLRKQTDTIKEYQNFRLINKRHLVFKNGLGSLKLKKDLEDDVFNYGYFIIEKGNQIYLIEGGHNGSVYVSFDKGATWYLYPLPLEDIGNYQFFEINDKNEISHFSNAWISGEGQTIQKIFHKFSPK